MTAQTQLPNQMPLVSSKDTVVFPQSNDPDSQKAVQQAFESHKLIFISCLQEEPERDFKKVYRVGCVCFIMRMRSLRDHRVKILIQGREEKIYAKIIELSQSQT